MINLRCTGKLLKVLGRDYTARAKSNSLPETPADWYANLLWLDGRKCALFTQVGTLFPVFALDVGVAELREPGGLLRAGLRSVLERIGAPADAVERVLTPLESCELAPSSNRRVLGSMNDYAFQAEFLVDREGGVRATDASALSLRVAYSPMSAIGYRSSLAALCDEHGIPKPPRC